MTKPSPVLVLQARAWARARLWAAGMYPDLETAIAPLMQFALTSGLADRFGADAVYQSIIATFDKVPREKDEAIV